MNKKTSIPRGKYYAPNKEGTLTLETPIGFFDISTKPDTTITTTAIWEFYEKLMSPKERNSIWNKQNKNAKPRTKNE